MPGRRELMSPPQCRRTLSPSGPRVACDGSHPQRSPRVRTTGRFGSSSSGGGPIITRGANARRRSSIASSAWPKS